LGWLCYSLLRRWLCTLIIKRDSKAPNLSNVTQKDKAKMIMFFRQLIKIRRAKRLNELSGLARKRYRNGGSYPHSGTPKGGNQWL
jgi:hypothetical protein